MFDTNLLRTEAESLKQISEYWYEETGGLMIRAADEIDHLRTAPLDKIMTAEEAALLWDLSASHVKHLCQDGKLVAKKFGKTWMLTKDQPNPKTRK